MKVSDLKMSIQVQSPPQVLPSETQKLQKENQALQQKINELEAEKTKANDSAPLGKDGFVMKSLKGGGKAGLIGALPSIPVAAYLLKTAPSGMGGLGQGLMAVGIGLAGAVGAGVGGVVSANTSGGSKTKGAIYGGLSSAALGGLIMTAGTNSKIGMITAVGAVAFGVAGAIGGAIGAKYDK